MPQDNFEIRLLRPAIAERKAARFARNSGGRGQFENSVRIVNLSRRRKARCVRRRPVLPAQEGAIGVEDQTFRSTSQNKLLFRRRASGGRRKGTASKEDQRPIQFKAL